MAQRSSIEDLPPEVLERISSLRQQGMTLDDLVEVLDQAGHERSRSALGRYFAREKAVSELLDRTKSVSETLVRELGDAAGRGRMGQLLVQTVQALAFDKVSQAAEHGEPLDITDLMRLSKAVQSLSSAGSVETKGELELRKVWAEEAAAAADKALAEAEGKGDGGGKMTRVEALQMIRRDILGLAA